MRNIFLLIFVIVLLTKCINNPMEYPDKPQYPFAIYFLKDTTLTISDIMTSNKYPFIENLSALELATEPWITQNDIEYYEWSSHNIFLKRSKEHFFPGKFGKYYLFPSSWKDKPWVVTTNGVPRYVGYFSTQSSVYLFPFPQIHALHVGLYPTDILTSHWIFWGANNDIRKNEMVKKTLIELGLFHGGIKVSIDTTDSPIKVFSDSTLEYTLKFQNDDVDDIFILDPDKTGMEVFGFYNNGPNLENIDTKKTYSSVNYLHGTAPPGSLEAFDPNWYTLLKSGESVKRTLKAKFISSIPPKGTYKIQTDYNTPYCLEKKIRVTNRGRYYVKMGEAPTDVMIIKILKYYKKTKN